MRIKLAIVLWVGVVVGTQPACGADGTADVADISDVAEVFETTADTVADAVAPVPMLPDAPGLALWLEAVEWRGSEAAELTVEVEGEGDAGHWHITAPGTDEPLWRIPHPDDSDAKKLASGGLWTLAPDAVVPLDPVLLTWSPGASEAEVRLRTRGSDGAEHAVSVKVQRGQGPVSRSVTLGSNLVLHLRAEAGLNGLAPGSTVGLTRRGSAYSGEVGALWDTFVADIGERELHVKLYDGTRRYLMKPGCESTEACAEGGAAFPCVETCACQCGPVRCDCDFSAIEGDMRARVSGLLAAVVPMDSPDKADNIRIHYVYKRSLGGGSSCAENGEVDVDALTYGAMFKVATAAAHRINRDYGYMVIAALSPQNESNHPLQDGRHENSAGQPYVAGMGLSSYVDLVVRSSCNSAGNCCDADRYVATAPDSIGQLAHALIEARTYRRALGRDDEPALMPPIGIVVYLDDEQVDPFIVNDDGPPSIVTPSESFFTQLSAALSQAKPGLTPADWESDIVFVDTYPGSWGPPWFEGEGQIIHHVEPTSARVLRGDPVRAADAALVRGVEAIDGFVRVFGGPRPDWVLGEVGWSSFDGAEA
ncbi:MAG: hypothetical protein ACI9MR_005195, partial [Myxococcota bacterium]